MRTTRTNLVAFVLGTLAVTSLSLSIERSAWADEQDGPLPKKEADPNAPAYATVPVAPLPAQSEAPLAQPAEEMPLLPAAPLPAAAPVGAPVAAPIAGERDVVDRPAQDPVLQPWDVDARAAMHTTPILQYGGVGASADAGMRKLGPGTLALGGGMDYFFCGTTCAATPLAFTQRQLSFEGRVSYHMAPMKNGRVDFYPLATAGFIVSRSAITVGDNSEYRASDVAPSVGFGAGASYFFADRFFVGAEVRFRYAAGSYSYELASGPAKTFDRSGVDTWSASTVDLAVAVGARF